MNVNYKCVPGCGTDNCNCRDCMFYGGMSHGTVRCLAEEEVNKAAAKEWQNKKTEDGDQE